MWVNPFIFGALCTIGVEIVVLFIYALILTWKRGKK